MTELVIIFRYRRANTYGHHAIMAALETDPPARPHRVQIASTVDDLIVQIHAARADGCRVLVAWSFYSPNAAAATAELAATRRATEAPPEHAPRGLEHAAPGHGAGGDEEPPDHEVTEHAAPRHEASGDEASGAAPAGVLHIAGGVHATAEPLATLRAGFDLVALGDGEATFTALAAALGEERGYATVPGLAFLDPAGRLVKTGPVPRYELDRYRSFPWTRRFTSPIEITRGCVYACSFCQTPFMFQARFRHRSVDSVRAHVRVMRERGLYDVRFVTPSALSYGSPDEGVDLDAVGSLLSGVRQELGEHGRVFFGSFPSELRPEHVSREALRLLKRYAANDNLIIGAQSGDEEMLRRSHRGHGVEPVIEAVRLCVAEGFQPNVDVIFGMPGETEDEAMATVRLAGVLAESGAHIHAHTFMPLPGTPWRDRPAGRIGPATLDALDRLTTRGRLYGQWQRQEGIAHNLATNRDPAPRRR